VIGLIWAEANGGVIGADGGIPWRLPEEQRIFKERTMGATVVMGRATWESLPAKVRPLPGRRNVVLTRTSSVEGAETASSVDEVLARYDDFWVMGGAAVYAAFLPFADTVVRTEVDLDVAGDTFAPALGPEWQALPDDGWQITGGVRWRVRQWAR
jgi:dihydrofolate reductase